MEVYSIQKFSTQMFWSKAQTLAIGRRQQIVTIHFEYKFPYLLDGIGPPSTNFILNLQLATKPNIILLT